MGPYVLKDDSTSTKNAFIHSNIYDDEWYVCGGGCGVKSLLVTLNLYKLNRPSLSLSLSLWLDRFTTCWLGWFGHLLISFDTNVFGFGWNLEYEVVLSSHAKILFLYTCLLNLCLASLICSNLLLLLFPLFLFNRHTIKSLSYNLYSKVVCLLKLLLVSSRSTKYNNKNTIQACTSVWYINFN